MEEDLGVPVGTLYKAVSVFNVLDGALFAALIRNFKGLIKEFDFGSAWMFITPVNGNDEFDPIAMFQSEISNLKEVQLNFLTAFARALICQLLRVRSNVYCRERAQAQIYIPGLFLRIEPPSPSGQVRDI